MHFITNSLSELDQCRQQQMNVISTNVKVDIVLSLNLHYNH